MTPTDPMPPTTEYPPEPAGGTGLPQGTAGEDDLQPGTSDTTNEPWKSPPS